MSHNSCNAEIVIKKLNRVANFHVLAVGVDIVNQNVIGSPQGPALQVNEWSQSIVRAEIDTKNILQSSRSRNFHDYGRNHRHVWQLRQNVGDFYGDGSIAQTNNV